MLYKQKSIYKNFKKYEYLLNEFELAFGKHLLKFIKAFAIGKDFAERITDESNS